MLVLLSLLLLTLGLLLRDVLFVLLSLLRFVPLSSPSLLFLFFALFFFFFFFVGLLLGSCFSESFCAVCCS